MIIKDERITMKNTKTKETKLAAKMIMCLIYLIIITFLAIYSYQLFQQEYKASHTVGL